MNKMNKLEQISGGLIVSCQALEDEPLHSSYIMGKMALAAVEGGAVGIRANSSIDISEIKENICVPIIGIVKQDYPDSKVFITPTMKEVDELVQVGADIIALDATDRIRPNGQTLTDLVTEIKEKYPEQILMADCATIEDVKLAIKSGFDVISSTLVGYTEESASFQIDADDFAILKEMMTLSHAANRFFIAEGNINTPEKMQQVLSYGCDAVVVGSMITRPQLITRKFTSQLAREINFIDMDGVLVDAAANIEEETINKISSSSAMPVINTGRLMHDIDYVVDKYQLKSNFKIAANGAHIQTRAGHDIIVHELPSAVRDEIYNLLRTDAFKHVRIEVNTKSNRYFFDERPADFPKEFKDSSIVTNIDEIITELNVIGFLVIFEDYSEISSIIEKLEIKYAGIVEFERSSQTSLEIYSSKASKGSAIKYLKDNGYIDSTVFTRAYGDSFNDVSMFKEVDLSYAIASHKEVEMLADHVISSLKEGL